MNKMKNVKITTLPLLSIVTSVLTLVTACGGGSGESNTQTQVVEQVEQTAGIDSTPETFRFSNNFLQENNSFAISDTVTISGIDTETTVTIENGEYSIDGGNYTAEEGTIINGQEVTLRATLPDAYNQEINVAITIGDVEATYKAATEYKYIADQTLEVESAELLGNAAATTDVNASNEQVVSGFSSDESGIKFIDVIPSISLTLNYASNEVNELTLIVDEQNALSVSLPNTNGDFQAIDIPISLAQGADLSLLVLENTATLKLDTLEFVTSPLQVVKTLATFSPTQSGVAADGISELSDGSVMVSGGPQGYLNKIDTEGNVTTLADGLFSANDSAVDSQDNLYFASYRENKLYKYTHDDQLIVITDTLDGPAGVYIDADDNVYVSIFGSSPTSSSDIIQVNDNGDKTLIINLGTGLGITGITGDEEGNLYAASFFNRNIYKIANGDKEIILPDAGQEINFIDYADDYIYIPVRNKIVKFNVLTQELSDFAGPGNAGEIIDGHIHDVNFTRITTVGFSRDKQRLYATDSTTGAVRVVYSPEQ
jgi:hypothetical protein